MTSHDYHAEELKKREEKKIAKNTPHIKSEKLLSLSNKISEHDLDSKIKKCKNWITKLHEIRVVVSADDGDMTKAEKITGIIEKETKEVEGRVLQKRTKDTTIKFTIMPTLKKEDQHTKGSTEQHEKKLLEPENLSMQQVRSFHLFWQLQNFDHQDVVLASCYRKNTDYSKEMSTKCDKDEIKLQSKYRLAAYVSIFIFLKYTFWSFTYRKLSKRSN